MEEADRGRDCQGMKTETRGSVSGSRPVRRGRCQRGGTGGDGSTVGSPDRPLVVQTDCSNAFNTAKRTAIMAQAAKSTPGPVGYIARCYDEIPAKAIYEVDSREGRVFERKSGAQQGDGILGPPLFCFVIIPNVSKLRPKYEPLGVRIEACMDEVRLHFKEITEE